MAIGTNNYPKSVDETMNILNTFDKTNMTIYGKKNNYKADGMEAAFAQVKDLSEVTCYHGTLQKPVLRRRLKKHKFILNFAKLCSKQVMMKMN